MPRRRRLLRRGLLPTPMDTGHADQRIPMGSPQTDERMSLLLEEAKRGIRQQQDDLDNLRSRAGTLVAAASLVSSFLGAATLSSHHLHRFATVSMGVALAALVVVIAAASYILMPHEWRWGIDVWSLLRDYIEPTSEEPASLDELRRSLAWYMQQDANDNKPKLDNLFNALTVALVAIGVEVGGWMVALWTR